MTNLSQDLKNILDKETLENRGFKPDESGVYSHEEAKESNITFKKEQDESISLYLRPESAESVFSYKISKIDDELSIVKIDDRSGAQSKINDSDKENILDILSNSSTIKQTGFNIIKEEDAKRSFSQRVGDWFSARVAKNPLLVEITAGLAVTAATFALGPAIAAAAGIGAGLAIKASEKKITARFEESEERKKSKPVSSLDDIFSKDDYSRDQSQNQTQKQNHQPEQQQTKAHSFANSVGHHGHHDPNKTFAQEAEEQGHHGHDEQHNFAQEARNSSKMRHNKYKPQNHAQQELERRREAAENFQKNQSTI